MVLKVVTGKILKTLELCRSLAACSSVLGTTGFASAVMRGLSRWQIQSGVAVRLSKNSGYLIDNLYRAILSEVEESDQEEKGRAATCFPNWDTRNPAGWSGAVCPALV
jgi:hypothetical protein